MDRLSPTSYHLRLENNNKTGIYCVAVNLPHFYVLVVPIISGQDSTLAKRSMARCRSPSASFYGPSALRTGT